MKLLTSGGVSNTSIHNARVDLLGKPIAEASAFFIPTAIYAMSVGHDIAARIILRKPLAPCANWGGSR
jgi:dipeptidase E